MFSIALPQVEHCVFQILYKANEAINLVLENTVLKKNHHNTPGIPSSNHLYSTLLLLTTFRKQKWLEKDMHQ